MSNACQSPLELTVMGNQIAVGRPPAGVDAGMVRRETVSTGVLLGGSVANPDLTPPPAGGGVNVPILEACAVIGVVAVVGVTVVIAREVTVRAAEEAAAEAVAFVVVAAKAVVSAIEVVMSAVEAAAKAGAVRFGRTEAAHVAASESPELTAAYAAATKSATNLSTTKSATDVAAAKSSAYLAASQSTAHVATASKSSTHVAATTTATNSSATTTTTADKPGGQGIRPRRCTERDGDEESHDLACDWLPLDAGR
jgi:hypothetical protein